MQTEKQAADSHGPSTGRQGENARGRLGPFLCWALVFADLGTSVYYTPDILFQQPGVGPHAALFVGLILIVAILTVVAVPMILVLIATQGSAILLGDLYAFGLLGAFTLTCLSLGIVRWHEGHPITDAATGARREEAG